MFAHFNNPVHDVPKKKKDREKNDRYDEKI